MNFKKTPKQVEATRLMADKLALHIMLMGGSRSGKTAIIVRNIIIRACKTKSRHVTFRRTFNSVKTSIWLDTLPKIMALAFPNLEVRYNKSDHVVIFPNGSEYWFCGLDSKERVEKILGTEFSTLHFNECSEIPYESVLLVMSRLAEKNSLKKIILYDQNPSSKKHWSYWLWVKHFDQVSERVLNKEEYVSIFMNPQDNINNIDPSYLSLLESLPEKERTRFLEGQFIDSDDGLSYYEFDRDRHVQDIDPNILSRIHEKREYQIGMDFNVDPMTATIGSYYQGVFYVVDEVFQNNSDTPRMCDELIKRKYYGAELYPDSTGKRRQTGGKTDFKELADRGFKLIGTRNPYQVDRVNNLNRLLKNDKIIIHPRCKKLIKDLEMVSWKNNELDKKGDPMLTHISDAFGYWTWALDNVVFGSRKSKTIQL